MREITVQLVGRKITVRQDDDGRFIVPDEIRLLKGRNVALKPAHEPIVVARKPFKGTVAQNVLEYGTGGINVDGCRIEGKVPETTHGVSSRQGEVYGHFRDEPEASVVHPGGRWPANVVLSHTEDCILVGTKAIKPSNGSGMASPKARGFASDGYVGGTEGGEGDTQGGYVSPDGTEIVTEWECAPDCPVATLDSQTGELHSQDPITRISSSSIQGVTSFSTGREVAYGDSGGPSRFFYIAKVSRAERSAGLENLSPQTVDDGRETPIDNPYLRGETQRRNTHPTVKPIELMRWLCRLVTPPGGLILDPFVGSGSTGIAAILEGFNFIGIEKEAEYIEIAEARIKWWEEHRERADEILEVSARSEREKKEREESGQLGLGV